LHDRNVWRVTTDGSRDPEIYFFSRYDDLDPVMLDDGNLLMSSMVGFPEGDLVIAFRDPFLVEFLTNAINPLAFEKDHRVCTLQGSIHQSFCVVRGGREDHFDPGDMCHQ